MRGESEKSKLDSADRGVAFKRPSFIEVDLDAVRFNVKSIKGKLGEEVKLLAVVKANAYGLGAPEISRAVSEAGAEFLGVAIVEEGVQLRQAGITTPIVVLYPETPGRARFFLEYDLVPTVSEVAFLERFNQICCNCGMVGEIFLKVDTGMGRYGFSPEGALSLAEELRSMANIHLLGLATNLSDPDDTNKGYSLVQVDRFRQVDEELQRRGFKNYLRSVANSTACLDLPESYFDLARIGHLLYGAYPSERSSPAVPIRPVLTVKSEVLLLKEVEAGRPLGYGNTYLTTKRTRVATLPIGYADGVPRALSNCGQVLVRGHRANIIGRICMDALMVDVTDIPGVRVGDEVVLTGKQEDETITVHEVAKWAGTISYEIISRLSSRLPRMFKHSEKPSEEGARGEELVRPTITEKAD